MEKKNEVERGCFEWKPIGEKQRVVSDVGFSLLSFRGSQFLVGDAKIHLSLLEPVIDDPVLLKIFLLGL